MRNARFPDRRRLRCACAALVACCAGPLHAQVSGSVGVVSDYRYRGYSLSDGDAAVQGSVTYDAANGAYAGLFASTVEYAGDSGAQLVPYAGWARRDQQGRSWDLGVRYAHFTVDSAADYVELHAGLALRRVALRLHYAPDYFGQVANWYVEADGSVALGARVQWIWHAGMTRSGEATAYRAPVYIAPGNYTHYTDDTVEPASEDRTRIDVRTGISLTTRACDVQLTWQHVDGDDATPYAAPFDPRDRAGWMLGCVHRW